MRDIKRTRQVFEGIGLILIVTSVVQAASITQLYSPPTANDIADWSALGNGGTTIFSGATVKTTGGDTITISFGFGLGAPGIVYKDSAEWTGGTSSFPAGQCIISNYNPLLQPPSTPPEYAPPNPLI